MGLCFLGGKDGFLRKTISDKLTSLGQAVGIGASATAFANAIQTIYTTRYTAGQDSLKVARKLTLTSSQTGSNVDITDNWYTTCDASAVYTAGQNSVKTARKLTLTSSQTGSNVDIADNWYTTCDASAVYTAGKSAASITRSTDSWTNSTGRTVNVWCYAAGYTTVYESSGHVTAGVRFDLDGTTKYEDVREIYNTYATFHTGGSISVPNGSTVTFTNVRTITLMESGIIRPSA